MGVATPSLEELLNRHRLIGADTRVFIYHLEDHPTYAQITQEIFEAWEAGSTLGVSSIITLLEILVKPRREGNHQAVRDYREMLTTYPNLQLLDLDLELADKASALRAKYNLKTPDAIQVAAAMHAGGTAFITNDLSFKRVHGIEVVLLDELLAQKEANERGSSIPH